MFVNTLENDHLPAEFVGTDSGKHTVGNFTLYTNIVCLQYVLMLFLEDLVVLNTLEKGYMLVRIVWIDSGKHLVNSL